jgi:hypothetical protein
MNDFFLEDSTLYCSEGEEEDEEEKKRDKGKELP